MQLEQQDTERWRLKEPPPPKKKLENVQLELQTLQIEKRRFHEELKDNPIKAEN